MADHEIVTRCTRMQQQQQEQSDSPLKFDISPLGMINGTRAIRGTCIYVSYQYPPRYSIRVTTMTLTPPPPCMHAPRVLIEHAFTHSV